ncbi:MAG: hypothetical protein M3144_11760, partial [Actinomycetota bacterium]|nr:hypothetical protein [Actinomycetota bacterium]
VVSAPDHPTVLYRLSRNSLSAADRALNSDIAVLERAVQEAETSSERRLALAYLRRHRARRHLVDAYHHARENRTMRSRREACGALSGSRSVALRGLALLAAPEWAVRTRDAKKFESERWLAGS